LGCSSDLWRGTAENQRTPLIYNLNFLRDLRVLRARISSALGKSPGELNSPPRVMPAARRQQ
jgi:hypothetical protein